MYIDLPERLVQKIKDLAEAEECTQEYEEGYEEIQSQITATFLKLADLIRHQEFEDSPDSDLSYIDMACLAIHGEEYRKNMTR